MQEQRRDLKWRSKKREKESIRFCGEKEKKMISVKTLG